MSTQLPGYGFSMRLALPLGAEGDPAEFRPAEGAWTSPARVGKRGLLELAELWPQERQLCANAVEGRLLGLRSRQPREDDPVRGRTWGAGVPGRLGSSCRAPGCHRVTAVLTATSSTVLHSDTIRRTAHAQVARCDQGSACIC